jgi:phospholipid transport system transporter-binding protein
MIAVTEGTLKLAGRLTMLTVPDLYAAGLQHLNHDNLLVDFSAVDAVDSAAVSMLLGWSRAAKAQQRSLQVVNLPDDLMSLANLYGVAQMLPQ